MTIPREFLVPYIASNATAAGILAVAMWRPKFARWISAAIFLWASITNATFAIRRPSAYVEYAPLALLDVYRNFINGWFSQHVRLMVLPIACGQLAIAVLLLMPRPWRSLGIVGAIAFLLGIAPLGVGSAFPFSLTFIAALLLMNREHEAAENVHQPLGHFA